MKAYYHDLFSFPLPSEHRFPISKYVRLRERIASELADKITLLIPEAATDEQLATAHLPEYIQKVVQGKLSEKEIRRMGFPWSPELVERSRRSVGSSIAACRAALVEGAAVNIAGGTHHACSDHGEGFCVFNDAVVAARTMQKEGRAQKMLVVDTDVHQGNGTAEIIKDDSNIFTFSIHGQKNFPFRKVESDLDIGLPDNTQDEEYLEALESGLEQAFNRINADMVLFLSGADPYIDDRLGRLSLSKEGLAARDRMVLTHCAQVNLPVALAMSGGYANVEEIVDIHFQTITLALNYWRDFNNK